MNSLSMEPLGAVAGTAASVFGFIQTVGGALLGTMIGLQFNGTTTPIALGYLVMARSRLAACSSPRTAGCSASARSMPEAARPPRDPADAQPVHDELLIERLALAAPHLAQEVLS